MMEKYDDTEDDLVAIQRTIETATGKVVHHTKAEREKIMMSTPENVRKLQQGAPQRSRGEYSKNKPGKPQQGII